MPATLNINESPMTFHHPFDLWVLSFLP